MCEVVSMSQRPAPDPDLLTRALNRSGLRMTHQRQMVFDVLMEQPNHPTADEIFSRVRGQSPHISLATIYNCLDTLVSCGVVRQVNHEREPTRFCANLHDHAHFYCTSCGTVHDIDLDPDSLNKLPLQLPEGFAVQSAEITLKGTCPDCSPQKNFSVQPPAAAEDNHPPKG